MGPPDNQPERRHRQPGRRAGDAYAATVTAHVEGDMPLIPASWTVGRVQKWVALVAGIVGLWAALSTYLTARLVTRQEVTTRIDSVKTDVKSLRGSTDTRLMRIELRQDQADEVHQLLVPMARIQCLLLDRDQSPSIAQASGLPCDSLLRRIGR